MVKKRKQHINKTLVLKDFRMTRAGPAKSGLPEDTILAMSD